MKPCMGLPRCVLVLGAGFRVSGFEFGGSKSNVPGQRVQGSGFWMLGVPRGSMVVPFCGSYLEIRIL